MAMRECRASGGEEGEACFLLWFAWLQCPMIDAVVIGYQDQDRGSSGVERWERDGCDGSDLSQRCRGPAVAINGEE